MYKFLLNHNILTIFFNIVKIPNHKKTLFETII